MAFATAIGAAIPVLIVGTVVWVGITNDRLERLDRRLDEAAGFAVPFVPRGLDQIPPSPNDQDVVITVRQGDQVRSNSDVVLPELDADYADTNVDGVRYRVRTVEIRGSEPPVSLAVGATYDDTIADTNNLHRRVLFICSFAIWPRPCSAGCWPRSRSARSNGWPSKPARSTPATRRPTSRSAAPPRRSRSPRRSRACWSASGLSRTARRPHWPRPATSPRCRPMSCARR